jgi:peptidoglycan/LPS O-acetylase OafA/YrhL
MSTPQPRGARLETLTSLRFFAAAMILVGHVHGVFESSNPLAVHLALNQGVSFFFVLSGFILAYVYPGLERPGDAGRFIVARFARVWPAHIATFLLVLLLVPAAGRSTVDGTPWWITGLNLAMLQSWFPTWQSFLSWNGVSWSISTEWFFYLCFIPLVAVVPRLGWRCLPIALLLPVGLIILCNVLALSHEAWAPGMTPHGLVYIFPVARIAEFILGMWLARWWTQARPLHATSAGAATAVELGTVLLAFAAMHMLPKLAYLPSVAGVIGHAGQEWLCSSGGAPAYAALIAVFASQRGWCSRVLAQPLPVLLGEISYAMYLVHTIWLRFYQGNEAAFADLHWGVRYAGYVALVLGTSFLVWYLVEVPMRNRITAWWKRRTAGGATRAARPAPAGPPPPPDASAIAAAWSDRAVWLVLPLTCVLGGWAVGVAARPPAAPAAVAAVTLTAGELRFAEGFTLRALTMDGDGALRFDWQLPPTGAGDLMVAVHLLDAAGERVAAADHPLSASGRLVLPAGPWVRLGLGLYRPPGALLSVEAARTDWDGHRVLIDRPYR